MKCLTKFTYNVSLIYTQYRIETKWKQNFLYFYKEKKYSIYIYVFTPLTQYWDEAPWAAITALSLFGYALHTWIKGYFTILSCKSSQARSSWMGIIVGQPYSGLSREVWKCSMQGFGCLLRVIVMFWRIKPLAKSEVLNTVKQVFLEDISVSLCLIQPLTSVPSPCCWKRPSRYDATTTMLHFGIVLGRWWAVPGFLLR